ncbi:MAG: DUF4381 domain-containing protein [Pseudomonadota bacterium]
MNPEFEGLNLVELLDLLEPVPQPDPISMTPQTAGWIWLGLIVVVLLFLAIRKAVNFRRANAYRRAAVSELAGVGDDAAEIAAILRRTALVAFPREAVAGLHGEDWLAFLNSSYPGKGFAGDAGTALILAPYREDREVPNLNETARDWIRRHKPFEDRA